MASPSDVFIRPYEPRDRDGVRRLCCETGFLGKPIDPVFEDRELFADYLTRYYTDCEPESCFMAEHEREVNAPRSPTKRKHWQAASKPRL